MKSNHLFTAIALSLAAAAGPVLAQEASYDYPQPIVSQTTRAAVLADLAMARAAGTLQVNEASVGTEGRFMAQRSREDVRAEVRLTARAARTGQAAMLTSETNAFAIETPLASAPVSVAAK